MIGSSQIVRVLGADGQHATAFQFGINGLPTLYFCKNGSLIDSG